MKTTRIKLALNISQKSQGSKKSLNYLPLRKSFNLVNLNLRKYMASSIKPKKSPKSSNDNKSKEIDFSPEEYNCFKTFYPHRNYFSTVDNNSNFSYDNYNSTTLATKTKNEETSQCDFAQTQTQTVNPVYFKHSYSQKFPFLLKSNNLNERYVNNNSKIIDFINLSKMHKLTSPSFKLLNKNKMFNNKKKSKNKRHLINFEKFNSLNFHLNKYNTFDINKIKKAYSPNLNSFMCKKDRIILDKKMKTFLNADEEINNLIKDSQLMKLVCDCYNSAYLEMTYKMIINKQRMEEKEKEEEKKNNKKFLYIQTTPNNHLKTKKFVGQKDMKIENSMKKYQNKERKRWKINIKGKNEVFDMIKTDTIEKPKKNNFID